MAKRERTIRTMIYNALYRKRKIEQDKPHNITVLWRGKQQCWRHWRHETDIQRKLIQITID